MNKRDYFIKCMNNRNYAKRDWVISAFTVVDPRPHITEVTYPYQLVYDAADPDALFVAVPIDTSNPMVDQLVGLGQEKKVTYQAIRIDGSNARLPLFGAKEGVDILDGELPLPHSAMNTSYGIILGNMYLLHYPFKQKFQFVNGVIGKNFDDHLSTLLQDNPVDGAAEDPTKIYVYEFERYGEACGALAAYDKIFASSGSLKSMTVDPSVIALRDQLIKKHAHELDDIRIQAQIEEQVVAADKASFKGDPAEDFLITGKSFNPTRKKQLIMIGGSAGFGGADGGSSSFIPTSLRDGWKVEDIPVHANEARAGSYFRGKETAMGGTDVKNGTRMGMNAKIAEDFCGSKLGIPTIITDEDYNMYVGLYIVGQKGPILITKENVKGYIGMKLMVYSPTHCITEGDGYCKVCIGETWSVLPAGVNNIITNIGDVYMYDKMKRMHGKALQTATFTFIGHIG